MIISQWVQYARLVRAQVLALREREFVLAARAFGVRDRHDPPPHRAQPAGPLVILMTLNVANNILLESSLTFLGLGVDPMIPSWGGMLADGRTYMQTAWWVSVFPGRHHADGAGPEPAGRLAARPPRSHRQGLGLQGTHACHCWTKHSTARWTPGPTPTWRRPARRAPRGLAVRGRPGAPRRRGPPAQAGVQALSQRLQAAAALLPGRGRARRPDRRRDPLSPARTRPGQALHAGGLSTGRPAGRRARDTAARRVRPAL